MEYLARVIDKLDVLIAGFIGSVIASWWHRNDLRSVSSWVVFLIAGIACAYYLAGMVSGYFDIVKPETVAGVGFLLGAFGGSMMLAVYRALKAADVWSLIRSRFGGGSS